MAKMLMSNVAVTVDGKPLEVTSVVIEQTVAAFDVTPFGSTHLVASRQQTATVAIDTPDTPGAYEPPGVWCLETCGTPIVYDPGGYEEKAS
jgi:hypothetical protein